MKIYTLAERNSGVELCEARNGTYYCQREPGHPDRHAMHFLSGGEEKVATWTTGDDFRTEPKTRLPRHARALRAGDPHYYNDDL